MNAKINAAKIAVDAKTNARTFAEETLIREAQLLVQQLMNERNISRSELARRAEISRPRLTKILTASSNMTLRTLARLVHAMDASVCLKFAKKKSRVS